MKPLFRNLLGIAFSVTLFGVSAQAQELAIWHDLGDNGNAWFQKAGEAFAKSHPGVSIKPSSFPTDQWFGRVIGAINTDSAPSLIYNNYERVIRIQSQTNKVIYWKTI